MTRYFRGLARPSGRPPGSYAEPDESAERTRIQLVSWDEDVVQVGPPKTMDHVRSVMERGLSCWLRVTGLSDPAAVQEACGLAGAHQLHVEDAFTIQKRPSFEEAADYSFITLSALRCGAEDVLGVPARLSMFLADGLLVSVEDQRLESVDGVQRRLSEGRGRIRSAGPDYLAYAMLDSVVDCYFEALERVSGSMDGLEQALVSEPAPETLREVHHLRTGMLLFRKSVWPLRDVIRSISRGDSSRFRQETLEYMRDAYDHTVQVIDTTETLREILAGMLDTYLSSMSNRMNQVMKLLTIVATIFIPLTFIAGIYGMNFRYMPELDHWWGYPAALLVMLLVGTGMVLWFKRKGWL